MFPNVGKKCKTAGMSADPTDGAGAVRRVPSRAEVLIGPSRLHTGQIASQAELDAATNADLLGGYLTATLAAAGADGRLTRTDLAECHEMGASAAEQGSSLAAVIDLYLSATWRLWADVNARAESATPATVGQVAAFLFRAADDAAEAVAAGYEAAQRQTVRREESLRREFVDDLLTGGGDPALLQERAPRFGFNLAATHVVAVARTHRLLIDGGPVQARVETYVLATFGGRDVVVATKAGLLICVLPVLDPDTARDLVRVLEESEPGPWQVAIGRPQAGPVGLVRAYEEARESLDLARRLGWTDRVVRYEALLPYRLLTLDPTTAVEMVEEILGPLQRARGGIEPMVETLEGYFAESGNVSATGRRIHLSARAVVYRLERIAQLTGYSPQDPESRFVLEVAVRARRLLRPNEKPRTTRSGRLV